MNKLKVMTIVGTRPEIIRLSRLIPKLDEYCNHILVHTGQNYDFDLNEVFFQDLGIRRPDCYLDAARETAVDTISQVLSLADKAMGNYRPDAVLLLGDTNSGLASIAAKRRMIPIFHMEAGNRCFDARVPEEINRRIIDHTADIHLPYSDIAREYLLREGLPPDQIIKTGSPMREVIEYYMPNVQASNVMDRLGLQSEKFILVSSHRQENVDSTENIQKIYNILNAIAERYRLPVVVSTHPRTRRRIDEQGLKANQMVNFMKPFGYFDYLNLQMNAKFVLSDSGTITEESSILNFPALNLREVHERPEGVEEATVMFVGLNIERIMHALNVLDKQPRGTKRGLYLVNDYLPNNVSDKVLRVIISYTDYVNRVVWKKN